MRKTKSSIQNRVIYPVILRVPEENRGLHGREKVTYLSRHARVALGLSAEKSRMRLGELSKDDMGAPLPFEGNYWSISHKLTYVAAVVAPERIGIDIEEIRPCSRALEKRVADEIEWSFSPFESDTNKVFYRFWTAKEAVLKAAGTGFKGFSTCRIKRIIDDKRIVVNYLHADWVIEQLFFDDHIASVVQNAFHVRWTIFPLTPSP